ncbi:LysR substrate-binding domain-containing protein [Veronia pacifica]|uniref:LysR family transcriptional regulator n=1 Tax=Veronia pacifica TaxID=1080227 RepID=A0A1C3EJS8_9GAMM|nr:LysR substrate-binding domain-containing protein [Veronia pacifica]ODA33486.1 LysR family transcriptional regulator [Veronia pacifica]
MDKNLRHLAALRYFEAAGRKKSYSAAALELNVTQAAVSQQIRALEANLDVKLFFRHGREMRLTSPGQKLFESTTRGFNEILSGFSMLQCEPLEGVLTINAPPAFASLWLMPRLWQFTHYFPSISLRVHADRKNIDLLHDEADMAIRQGVIEKGDIEDGIACEPLYSEAVFPLCSPSLAASMKFTDPAQVLDCLLVHGVNSRSFIWSQWFEKAGVNWRDKELQFLEVPAFDMALNAVTTGHGMCLATESLSRELINRGLLVRPFDIELLPGVQYSLLYQKVSPRRQRIQVFSDWLKGQITDQKTNNPKLTLPENQFNGSVQSNNEMV